MCPTVKKSTRLCVHFCETSFAVVSTQSILQCLLSTSLAVRGYGGQEGRFSDSKSIRAMEAPPGRHVPQIRVHISVVRLQKPVEMGLGAPELGLMTKKGGSEGHLGEILPWGHWRLAERSPIGRLRMMRPIGDRCRPTPSPGVRPEWSIPVSTVFPSLVTTPCV